jgi:hypothetical protein
MNWDGFWFNVSLLLLALLTMLLAWFLLVAALRK